MTHYHLHQPTTGVPVKMWTDGVPVEDAAVRQLDNVASLPFVWPWVAVMPDVHLGYGATVGSVIPTRGAVIPAAVGVDIGCGMIATRTSLDARHLPDSLKGVRSAIEKAVPHGRTASGGRGDRGAWGRVPEHVAAVWAHELADDFERIAHRYPAVRRANDVVHLGTLGTGNHFVEVCLDESNHVWLMLHSGSRGVGNKLGSMFIELARAAALARDITLPDRDLAWLDEGTELFDDYWHAVSWAQHYARLNRALMMEAAVDALRSTKGIPAFEVDLEAVNCHHNYVAEEHHHGERVYVTRKGAVRAGEGELGIIPGSMGTRSYIVRGKGNEDSFCSCSHGAGRSMSRGEARRRFTVADHVRMTQGVECRKDASVIDETPAAYKDIDAVMAAQDDLVEVVHTLRQVVCVKG